MNTGSRSGLVLVAASLVWGGITVGCNRERKKAEHLLAETFQSYLQLQPKLTQLKTRLGELRGDVEELAAKVPGGPELRAKYFSAEEVLGVLDAKMRWLSGEIESARRDLERARVDSLRNAIKQTNDDIRQVSDVAVELTHEEARLKQLAALLKAPYEHRLPTGYWVKAAKDDVESHLIDFIEDANPKVDRTTWFDCDRLRFTGGGADLDLPDSRSQLDNMTQILRAYPDVKLKIGGYNDNEQAAAASKKLSASRAAAVRAALVQSGVNADRLEAEGRGLRHPACSASDPEECSAHSPRIAVLVTAK